MAQTAMKKVFMSLIDEAKKDGGLRDLLVDTGKEAERPRLKIDGATYYLGLIDDKPMLVKESDKSFLNPETLEGGVHEIYWKLKF